MMNDWPLRVGWRGQENHDDEDEEEKEEEEEEEEGKEEEKEASPRLLPFSSQEKTKGRNLRKEFEEVMVLIGVWERGYFGSESTLI
jgi:hypothetical protein